MKIARERGDEATLTYNNLKINKIMYTMEQFGEEGRVRKEVCVQPNMTSNPKKTASDRLPCEKRNEEKEGRDYKMTRIQRTPT